LEAAILDFNKALIIDPEASTYYAHRGLARTRAGDLVNALFDLNNAIALDPANPEAYYNRALTHEAIGNAALAIPDLEKYLELNPAAPDEAAVLEKISQLEAQSSTP
jgi:tetratricopeptide (TPR) repeat protein